MRVIRLIYSLAFAIACLVSSQYNLEAQSIFQVPDACSVALKQDVSQMAFSSNEQLAYLGIIDQRSYDLFKQDFKGSVTIPIEGVPVEGSSDYSSYDEHRKSLYQSVQYNYSQAVAENTLSQVTSARAYQSFDTCMKSLAQTQQGFYAWRVSEDQQDLIADCQYHAPPAAAFPLGIIPKIAMKISVSGGVFKGTSKTEQVQKLGAYDHCSSVIVERTDKQKIILSFAGGGYNAVITSTVATPPSGTAILSYLPLKRVEETISDDMGTWGPPLSNGTPDMNKKGPCNAAMGPASCDPVTHTHLAIALPFSYWPKEDGDIEDPGSGKIAEARDVSGDGGGQFCDIYQTSYLPVPDPNPGWPAPMITYYKARAGKHVLSLTTRCWGPPALWKMTFHVYHMIPGDQVVTSSTTFGDNEDFIMSLPIGNPSKIQLQYGAAKIDVIKAGDSSADGKIKLSKTFDFGPRTFYVYHYAP